MRNFELTILDADDVIYRGKAQYCGIRTTEGEYGLEAGHESFMAVLAPGGAVRYRLDDGMEQNLPVHGGVLKFAANSCTILVDARRARA